MFVLTNRWAQFTLPFSLVAVTTFSPAYILVAFVVCVAQALAAMRLMHSEKAILPELSEQFEAAEAWLRPMRP